MPLGLRCPYCHDAIAPDQSPGVACAGCEAVHHAECFLEGEGCAAKIKEELHGDVRGKLFSKQEKPEEGAKCIACGKPASCVVYVGRQY